MSWPHLVTTYGQVRVFNRTVNSIMTLLVCAYVSTNVPQMNVSRVPLKSFDRIFCILFDAFRTLQWSKSGRSIGVR